jgi:hypothetical protein
MASQLRQLLRDANNEIARLTIENRRKVSTMEDEFPDGIGFVNLALWCEITEHSFSAKDEDKVVMNYRGQKRLSCGPCAAGIFSIPEPPSKSQVRGTLDSSQGM